MILSDAGIRAQFTEGRTLVWRALNRAIQPSSIDVRLGNVLRLYVTDIDGYVIDVRDTIDHTVMVPIHEDGYLLQPGGFALAATRERVSIPDDLCGFLVGRSGIARIGLQIEAAGLLDPGYSGCPTLELFNQSPYPIRLYDAMPIGQVYFVKLDRPAELPYGHKMRTSKYQNDSQPVASRMFQESRP